MKRGDLIIVYKVYVGSLSDKDVQAEIKNVAENFSLKDSPNIVQYFIPVNTESEHPIEVIDTSNVRTDILSLLEELIEKYRYNVKIDEYES